MLLSELVVISFIRSASSSSLLLRTLRGHIHIHQLLHIFISSNSSAVAAAACCYCRLFTNNATAGKILREHHEDEANKTNKRFTRRINNINIVVVVRSLARIVRLSKWHKKEL